MTSLVDTAVSVKDVEVEFSLFSYKWDNEPTQQKSTLGELFRERHVIREEKDGPLFCAATFMPESTRLKENVISVNFITLDFDHLSKNDAVKVFGKIRNLAYVAASSFSHQNNIPNSLCFRIIIPTTKTMSPAVFDKVIRQAMFEFDELPDKQCKDSCRMFYLPAVAPENKHMAFIKYHDGELYDVDAAIERYRERAAKEASSATSVVKHEAIGDVEERAARYLAKIPPAISGQGGHNATFYAACVLVRGFALPTDSAKAILSEWNQSCQPPWSDKELNHKIADAAKAQGPIGQLVYDNNYKYSAPKAPEPSAQMTDEAVQNILSEFNDIITGKRYCVQFPWESINSCVQALYPGFVTIFCGSPGATKSLTMIQCLSYWIENNIKASVLEMEDSRVFHLRRALAQLAAESKVTNDRWIKEYGLEINKIVNKHQDALKNIGKKLFTAPADLRELNHRWVESWVEERFQAGDRVLIIDPISFIDSEKVWTDEKMFLRSVKKKAEKYGGSIIMVTHPRNEKDGPSLENISGSRSIVRFSQTVFWLEYHGEKDGMIKTPQGVVNMSYNRTLSVLKGRTGGQSNKIALMFDKESLLSYDVGLLGNHKLCW